MVCGQAIQQTEPSASSDVLSQTALGFAREVVIAGEDARRSAMIAPAAVAAEGERRAAVNTATDVANEAVHGAAIEAATAAVAATEAATGVERERAAVMARNDLRNRLNVAVPTRDSDRGLISEIGGMQFATGTAEVDTAGRESLARFSGIVASYSGLRFSIEGHTDNVGSVATNGELSLRRAITVRDYLIGQGVAASSVDVAGLGASMPIGDNSTVDGRARNHRVEIVISGGPLTASGEIPGQSAAAR
jgi:outer membrane protein OmpA-like peptidoglycan-associated protein